MICTGSNHTATTDQVQFQNYILNPNSAVTAGSHVIYKDEEFLLENNFLCCVKGKQTIRYNLPKELHGIKGCSLAYKSTSDRKLYLSGGKCNDRMNTYLYFFDFAHEEWDHTMLPLTTQMDGRSLMYHDNLILMGSDEISWVDLKTMKQQPITKFNAKYCLFNNESCWMFNESEILLLQREMSYKILLHQIPLNFEKIDQMKDWIQMTEDKSNIIHEILDKELKELCLNPTQDVLNSLPILGHFQLLIHQFPLLLKVKDKNTLLKLVPILRDVERSFKVRLTYYFKYMIASIYSSVIQIKNQTVPIYENSTLSILYELGDAFQVLNTLKKFSDYKSLPHIYKEANHMILKNIMILPYPDQVQLVKLKWYNRIVSILKPLTSIVSPQQLVSKFIEIIFSSVGKHGTMLVLEVSKTEQQLKDIQKGLYPDVTEIVDLIHRYPCEQDISIIHEEIQTFKVENDLNGHQEGLFEEFIQVSIRYKEKMMFVKSLDDPATYQLMKQFLEMFTPLFQLLTPTAVQILLNSASKVITRMCTFGAKYQNHPDRLLRWDVELEDIILCLEKDMHDLVHELVIHDPKNGKIFEQTIGWISCLGMMWKEIAVEEVTMESILKCIQDLKI
jgi:hypothetical protein